MSLRLTFLPASCLVALFAFSFRSALPALAAVKDACSVITPADAQAVLGEPVGPAKSATQAAGPGDGFVCKYKSTIGNAFRAKSLSVTVQYSRTDLTGSANGIAESEKQTGYQDVHMVPGVGSAAVWGTLSMPGRPQGELTVFKGKNVMLIILVKGVEEGAALERAKSLAL